MKKFLFAALLALPLVLSATPTASAQRFGGGGCAINIGPGPMYAGGPLYNYGPFSAAGAYARPPFVPQNLPYVGGYASLPFAVNGYPGFYSGPAYGPTQPPFYSFGR